MVPISNRLKEAMQERGFRQADVVRISGIDKGQLSAYLSGRYKPKQDNIYLLAKTLNVSEAWLLGYDTPMQRAHPSPASPAPDPPDQLLVLYNSLNADGQRKVIEYTDDLVRSGKYKKDRDLGTAQTA